MSRKTASGFGDESAVNALCYTSGNWLHVGGNLNLARLRSRSSLLVVAASIAAMLFGMRGPAWMSGQVATAATPVIPPFHISGGPPPLGPMKMRAVTGEPYTLTAKTTIEKKYTDGSWHTTSYQEHRIRDSEGRERSELLNASGGPIFINLKDPTAQTLVALNRWSKTATVTHVPLPSPEQEARTQERQAKAAAYRAAHPAAADEDSPLPPQTIAGVYAEGRRHINVLHAMLADGQQDRVVEDTWTAPDLGIALARTSDDPRGQKITMTVTDLDRNEPDPGLFQIPPDYTVVEQK